MATAKEAPKTVRLTHKNGATVVVDADRADLLIAGGMFSTPKRQAKAEAEK